jgi:copper chaperone CopZ
MIVGLGYAVTGKERIRCAGCGHRIRHALRRQLAGVHEVSASAEEQEIAIGINTERTGLEQAERHLKQLGYDVAPLSWSR